MGTNHPRPTGNIRDGNGDLPGLPDRGTGTGLNGDTYGADISPTAINRQGGIAGATKSHAPDEKPGCNNRKGC